MVIKTIIVAAGTLYLSVLVVAVLNIIELQIFSKDLFFPLF